MLHLAESVMKEAVMEIKSPGRSKMAIGALAATTLLLAACGKKSSGGGAPAPAPAPAPVVIPSGPPAIPGLYTYMFRDLATGCSTGRQSFGSLEEMCSALLDEARNNGCAQFLRQTDHLMRCRGQAGPQPLPPVPPIHPGSPLRNVWCTVGARDFSRGWASMFNQRSNFRAVFWDSRQRQAATLPFIAGGRYGDARVVLSPGGEGEGRTEITLQQDGGRAYLVRGRLSHSTRLQVDDARQESSVMLDCGAVDPAVAVPGIGFSEVACQITHRVRGRRVVEEKIIPWSGGHIHQDLLPLGPSPSDDLEIRLLPAPAPDFAVVELESVESERRKRIFARGSLREGFEFRHQDRRSHEDTRVVCAPR